MTSGSDTSPLPESLTLPAGAAAELSKEFDRAGYAVIESVVPQKVLGELIETAQALTREHDFEADREVFRTDDRDSGRDREFFASARGVRGFLEAEALDASGNLAVSRDRAMNKIGHALHDSVPAIRAFASCALVREAFAVAGLRGAHLVQSMLIFKQPNIGGEVRWHQDASYLRCEPQRVVGLWLALEAADRENGCLWVVPGAHRGPLRERYTVDWRTEQGELSTIDRTPWPAAGAVPLEVPAGSLVVFHDHLPHRSDANRSARSRVALTLHAHDRASVWASDNWLQRGHLAPFRLAEL